MKNGVLKLGFAPTRRVLTTPKAFNKDEARRIKDCIEAEIRTYPMLELVTLDTINDEGLLFDVADAEKAAALFLREQVDAVFIPHCNFGSEEAVAKLARAVGKPVLIWGPRDAAPDANGDRLTDTQCGMFATTKVLQQFGVKFTYITNCALSDPKFREGFDTFLRAASVVKAMRHLRIGQIGTRPEIFWSVKVNERELMEKFGIEIVPITMTDLSNLLLAHEKAHSDLVQAEAASLKTRFPKSGYSDDAWARLANLKLTLRAWAEEKQVSAIAAQCWRPMDTVAGVAPCFVFSELTGEGLPVICESDIHGAVSSVIAAAASRYQSATFLADLTIRHPTNDNAELLWHCGVFPHVLAKQEAANVALHFNRRNPAVGSWELKHGEITIVRFDGLGGAYSCLFGEGRGIDGPKTFGTYLWARWQTGRCGSARSWKAPISTTAPAFTAIWRLRFGKPANISRPSKPTPQRPQPSRSKHIYFKGKRMNRESCSYYRRQHQAPQCGRCRSRGVVGARGS